MSCSGPPYTARETDILRAIEQYERARADRDRATAIDDMQECDRVKRDCEWRLGRLLDLYRRHDGMGFFEHDGIRWAYEPRHKELMRNPWVSAYKSRGVAS